MPSQAVQRISIRWLPEPAYENTSTIALNVNGYFIDLRVVKDTQVIEWSRAGERIALKREPPTFRWTRIIDSTGVFTSDEAYFEKLANGDDLEIGQTACPHRNGELTNYQEVWRDITTKVSDSESSWILQSQDGNTFIGKVGSIYLAITSQGGDFAARREDREAWSGKWHGSFEAGNVSNLPTIAMAVQAVETGDDAATWSEGQTVNVGETGFVFRGVCKD